MKKQIMTVYSLNKLKLFENSYISEFFFVNILNGKNRKCSISWEYRLYLIKIYLEELRNDLLISYNFKGYLNEIDKFYLKLPLEKFGLIYKFDSTNKKDVLLLLDLLLIYNINEKDKRNYHLWKYITHIYYIYSELKHKIFILSFCFMILINDPLDYSAYSNIRNFLINLQSSNKLDKNYKEPLKIYLHKLITVFEVEAKSLYLKELLNII